MQRTTRGVVPLVTPHMKRVLRLFVRREIFSCDRTIERLPHLVSIRTRRHVRQQVVDRSDGNAFAFGGRVSAGGFLGVVVRAATRLSLIHI